MIRHILFASVAFAAISTSAIAQDAPAEDEGGIKDIVVTAQRRAENVQDVPIAISAFSGEQLEARGVQNTLQLGQYIPNFVAQNNTGLGSANAYFLRGLGNTESIATFDPPVGTYVNDIYLSRQAGNNLAFFDVERIEVLRGPQGTLFGRNTTGGAVNIILKDPGQTLGGYAELGYGRFEKFTGRASIDTPLNDDLSLKFSGYFQNDKGYAKNVTTGERMNDDDGWGVRLGIGANLGDSIKWTGSYAHVVNKGENILNFQCNPNNVNDCDGRFITGGYREKPIGNPFGNTVITGRKGSFDHGSKAETDIITSNFQIDLSDNMKLSLISGYVSLEHAFGLDFFDGRTGNPTAANANPPRLGLASGGFVILNDATSRQYSQEVKLTGSIADGFVDYVIGGYYIDEKNTTDLADLFAGFLLADRTIRNTLKSTAGYAQFDFNVSEQFKLTAGIRYTDETKKISFRDNRASCNDGTVEATCLSDVNLIVTTNVPAPVVIPRKQSISIFTPRFAANFKPNDDILLFASATRGFKSGGWNPRGTRTNELLPFAPEKVWSYEAGIKSDLFDKRMRANLTLFYMDVSDLQTPSAISRGAAAPGFITRNFADYRNKGAELELNFVPIDNMDFYVNVGYQDDEYRVDRNAPATDRFGVQSVVAQQAACRTALAAGNVPTGSSIHAATLPPQCARRNGQSLMAVHIVRILGLLACNSSRRPTSHTGRAPKSAPAM
jgi:iron complex outermembrane recepter protein